MSKSISKTRQAIDFLELISEPNSLDVIAVAKKVNCSERLVWSALRKIREKNDVLSQEFSLVKEIASDLIWISSYMEEEMVLKGNLKPRDKRRLNIISERVDMLLENVELHDYIKIKEEKDIRKQLKTIEKRKAKELQEYIELKEVMEEIS